MSWRSGSGRDRVYLLMLVPVVAFFVIFPLRAHVRGADRLQGWWRPARDIWREMDLFANFELSSARYSSGGCSATRRAELLFHPVRLPDSDPVRACPERHSPAVLQALRAVGFLPAALHLDRDRGRHDGQLPVARERRGQSDHRSGRRLPIHFFNSVRWFRPLFVGSEIWQSFGWGSIIYLAALTTINPELYESATVDGASRLQRIVAHRPSGHPADDHDPAHPADGQHSGRGLRADHPHVQPRPPTRWPTSSRPTCTAAACCRPT